MGKMWGGGLPQSTEANNFSQVPLAHKLVVPHGPQARHQGCMLTDFSVSAVSSHFCPFCSR